MPTPTPVLEKSAPPPLPDQETQSTGEPNKKDMKKASDHEPPKLPLPKHQPKPSVEFSKPSLPLKKPVPPKPSTKPILPSKKPVPKPPIKSEREIPSKTSAREQEILKSSLKDGLKDGLKDEKSSDATTTNEDCNLDVVTPHEPLKQLTANRAGKQQSKRPPSTTRQSEGNLMETLVNIEVDEEEKENPAEIEPKEPAWKREATKAREEREAKKLMEQATPSPGRVAREKKVPPPVLGKPDEIIEKRKSWLREDIKKPEGAPSEEVSGLRKEVTDLRALLTNIEKKMAAMERKHEEKIESLEKRLEKDIEQLTSDFDEERTNHARLKIEVDRLKKKMRRGSGSIDGDESSQA
ncbi:SH3 domain-containing kinase-binding protein 1-like [Actinia tenebrosa]|uniref:SH3 domain-containing kinase-binding protein 1-like n=1 Tax=Actinia tenebrosa TaxID=6105 RepID=A0A6P8IQS6_ACTTE|nr:SH3 domain-containing kinase-binding protein 1-like [Actinia tenebrosa]